MISLRRIARAANLIRADRRCAKVGGVVGVARRWYIKDALRRLSRLYGGGR